MQAVEPQPEIRECEGAERSRGYVQTARRTEDTRLKVGILS